MHDTLTIGIPLFAILAGILLNRSDVKELRVEIKDVRREVKDLCDEMLRQFDAVDARFNAIDAELRFFHGVTGKLDGRIEAIEKRQS